VELLCTLLLLYFLVIIARIIMSWFPIAPDSPMEGVASLLYALTEPVMGPVRRVLPPVRLGGMGLDLSPIVVIIGLRILMAAIGC
jgi:YggT family protein